MCSLHLKNLHLERIQSGTLRFASIAMVPRESHGLVVEKMPTLPNDYHVPDCEVYIWSDSETRAKYNVHDCKYCLQSRCGKQYVVEIKGPLDIRMNVVCEVTPLFVASTIIQSGQTKHESYCFRRLDTLRP